MAKYQIVISTLAAIAESTLGNSEVKRTLFGEYSDGTPRNLPDAIRNEKKSPIQKSKKKKKKKKKYKKYKKFTF